ncbi:Mth938-like domain-containing protein [Pukyongiella litopenaei]|uniref:Mth938-like domain-containing protein n=1 Tax=Pukyongiella litopenaei TaxID=2605946 RepID=A0A2S0MKF3_9RHOB|nr:Mth938-like domain-containing protein [Pukyongiella litopenaei]AVO36368.1 hypothetical protein C6Y53_00690 [Pukyongiella litopenaei]
MRLNEMAYPDGLPVDGYGAGFFRIGGEIHKGAVVTGPGGTGPWGGLDDAEPLIALADRIDVLLIGTGAEMLPVPAPLRQRLEQAGVGMEHMGSPAACRTYNVLLAEGRRVALALLPV